MKNRILSIYVLFSFTIAVLFTVPGCSSGEVSDSHSHQESPSVAVTLWTGAMEMFTEYEVPVAGRHSKFIVHLTKLADFSPVRSGSISLMFAEEKGAIKFEKNTEELLREGIFTLLVKFGNSGKFTASLTYEGEGLKETFRLGTIEVHNEHPNQEEEMEEDHITFLKEQQWKTEFGIQEVTLRQIRPSVTAVGEVVPRQQDHIEIAAPVAGVLDPAVNRYMAAPGSIVNQGTVIALLAPQAGAGESWQQVNLAFKQSEDRYLRGKRLMKSGAISKREFEDLRREYLLLRAGSPKNIGGKNRYFSVTSPIYGIIEQLIALPGQHVEKGDPLVHITNRDKVWLKMNIYEIDIDRLVYPRGADIKTTGKNEILSLREDKFTLLSRRGIFDKSTGSVPFIFEVVNEGMKLKVGQMVEARIYTGPGMEALCVPVSSVYNDEGRKVVFIQTGGESFEKRPVHTGSVYRGYIEILSGISAGEHVVSKGVYFVKLAGISTDIGHGHTH